MLNARLYGSIRPLARAYFATLNTARGAFYSLYLSNYRIMFVVELATMDYERSGEDGMEESVEHYRDAVKTIKTAILQSQYEAAKLVNEKVAVH